ncbi:UNVERIFIED_CONTAM: hypothetical protein FKN15_061847 [Acipenser sinensis]
MVPICPTQYEEEELPLQEPEGEEPVRPVSGAEEQGAQQRRPPPALPLLLEEPAAPPALPPLSEEPAAPPEGDGLLVLRIAWGATSYKVRWGSGASAVAFMASGSPPEFASRGSAAAAAVAVASRGSAVMARGCRTVFAWDHRTACGPEEASALSPAPEETILGL